MGQSTSTNIFMIQTHSTSECIDYLVSGYTFEEINRYRLLNEGNVDITFKPINQIIGSYLGNIFLRFNVCPSSIYPDIIHDKGSEIVIQCDTIYNKPFIVGNSYGFDVGIHTFKIQILSSYISSDDNINNDAIGIIANIKDCEKYRISNHATSSTAYFYQNGVHPVILASESTNDGSGSEYIHSIRNDDEFKWE
eukprot:274676_1